MESYPMSTNALERVDCRADDADDSDEGEDRKLFIDGTKRKTASSYAQVSLQSPHTEIGAEIETKFTDPRHNAVWDCRPGSPRHGCLLVIS